MTYDPYKPPAIEAHASHAATATGFRPSIAGLVASVLLGFSVALGVVETILYFSGLDPDVTAGVTKVVSGAGTVARLVGAFAFLFWIHRVVSNAHAFGGGRMRSSPGRAVGYWFIPFINLVHGYQIVSETWQASDPESAAEGSGALSLHTPAGFILHWWLAYVASRIAVAATRLSWSPAAYILSAAFEVVAVVLMIMVIRRLDERQHACAVTAYRPAVDPAQ